MLISKNTRELYKSKSLSEYDEKALLQCHHSMMNGLQVVQSLLSIKAIESKDITVNDYLKKSQSLISVLAAIHQIIVSKKFIYKMNCNDYLKILVNDLNRIHENSISVIIRIDAEDIIIDTQNAITIGFVINELVSNSFKHAFQNKKSGNISIQIQKSNNGHYLLEYMDDGVGYDEKKVVNKLGMELVHLFTEKLKGELVKVGNFGTCYQIRFK